MKRTPSTPNGWSLRFSWDWHCTSLKKNCCLKEQKSDVLVETTLFAKLHQLNEKQESVLLPSVDSSYNNIGFFFLTWNWFCKLVLIVCENCKHTDWDFNQAWDWFETINKADFPKLTPSVKSIGESYFVHFVCGM